MKKVNFCANRFRDLSGNWKLMYLNVINAFHELGYDINKSKFLTCADLPPFVNSTIKEDSEEDVYVYNHVPKSNLIEKDFYLGRKTLILKPTGPTPEYFTIDTEGYAASSSITYTKPCFEGYDSTTFFEDKVPFIKESREHKWSDRPELQFLDSEVPVPDNHILIMGQMPGDETVTKMSFGDHWRKLEAIVDFLSKRDYPLVVKVHPTLKRESNKPNDEGITGWSYYYARIKEWKAKGVTVLYGFESLHDILPKTKIAILENSTSGIDCLLYDVPIISYGYPEYHWVTFDLRHLQQLPQALGNLDWYSKELSRSWLSWYCVEYQCYNYSSTLKRLKEIL